MAALLGQRRILHELILKIVRSQNLINFIQHSFAIFFTQYITVQCIQCTIHTTYSFIIPLTFVSLHNETSPSLVSLPRW